MQLLLATRNAHKTGEVAALLGHSWRVTDLTAHPEIPSPEETGTTFPENAELKAVSASRLFAGLVLADDSGLEVAALNGEPGVRSARYAGERATDAQNRAQLRSELQRIGAGASAARFCCAMVLAQGGSVLGHFEGFVQGTLLPEETGGGGFGYDSLFVPVGERQSFGELPAEVKNRLSHRARALAKVVAFLQSSPELVPTA